MVDQDSLFSSIIIRDSSSSSGAGDGLLGVGGEGAAANQRAVEAVGNAQSRGLFGAAAAAARPEQQTTATTKRNVLLSDMPRECRMLV